MSLVTHTPQSSEEAESALAGGSEEFTHTHTHTHRAQRSQRRSRLSCSRHRAWEVTSHYCVQDATLQQDHAPHTHRPSHSRPQCQDRLFHMQLPLLYSSCIKKCICSKDMACSWQLRACVLKDLGLVNCCGILQLQAPDNSRRLKMQHASKQLGSTPSS
jgi:hypothetical protein